MGKEINETTEMWNDYHNLRNNKKRDNQEYSTNLLKENDIPFESKNFGVHLIVMNRWDFWPSTGLFIDRKNQRRNRGVRNLLKLAKRELA